MASGAAKRVSSSVVDWARFAAVIPKAQIETVRVVKAKHDSFINKVYALPESLPKIDFNAYKSRLPDPTMADRFQTAYQALNIPYPVDKENVMKKVEEENDKLVKQAKALVEKCEKEIAGSRQFLQKLDTLPKYEEMSVEVYNYYFPETAHNFDPSYARPLLEQDERELPLKA